MEFYAYVAQIPYIGVTVFSQHAMSKTTNSNLSTLDLLAQELSKSTRALANQAHLQNARVICMDGRSLYSAFEDKSVLLETIDESERQIVLQSLLKAKAELDKFGVLVKENERSIFIKIQRSMAERIEIVRYSTINSLKEMLDEYEQNLRGSLTD